MEDIKINDTALTPKNRIDWIDIFKAIAIILMVIGHSTGEFNRYIYQFHINAFFLISGYTFTLKKSQTSLDFIFKKVYTLLVPIISIAIFMLTIMSILNHFGIYDIFFQEGYSYIGFMPAIKFMILNGSMYAWWLGAAWFVFAIFAIFIFYRFFMLKINNIYFRLVFSFFMYCLGIYLAKMQIYGYVFIFCTTFMLIGQFYFSIGKFLQEIFSKFNQSTKSGKLYDIIHKLHKINQKSPLLFLIGFVFSMLIMHFLSKITGVTVDYPGLDFKLPFLSIFAVLNGCLALFCLSNVISRYKKLKNIFLVIGKHSLAIMCLHFMYFKIGHLILILFGIADISIMANLLPGEYKNFWLLYSIISIFFSIITWDLICRFKIGKILLANDEKILKYSFKPFYIPKYIKYITLILIVISFCAKIYISLPYVQNNTREIVQNFSIKNDIQATQNIHKDGWAERTASISLRNNDYKYITISGIFPETLPETSNITITIGDTVQEYNILESEFDLKIALDNQNSNDGKKNNVINIASDFGINADGDIRELAFVIQDIQAE